MIVIAATWVWLCVPKIVQTVLSPKYRVDLGGEAPYSKVAALADYGLYYLLIGVCAIAILTFVTVLPRTGGLGLACLLAPWAYMIVRDLYVPTKPSHEAVCYPLIVIALWVIQPRMHALRHVGYLVAATAIISIALAVVMPSHAIYQSQAGELIATEKQILPLGILVGIFTQGNTLGQFLVVGLPFVFLIPREKHRLLLVLVTALALIWTASRGALVSAGIGILAYLLIFRSAGATRRLLSWLIPLAVTVLITIVPFLTSDTRSFSNRGLIWQFTLRGWAENVWFGGGVNWFSMIGSTSDRFANSAFHGHNQVVHFLATGGLVLALLAFVQVLITTGRATRFARFDNTFAIAWMSVLIGSGLFERTFSYVDNGNFLLTASIPFAFLMFARTADTGSLKRRDTDSLGA